MDFTIYKRALRFWQQKTGISKNVQVKKSLTDSRIMQPPLFCSVLQPSLIRELATPWTYFLNLSLSYVILIGSSTGSFVHALMLSIRAV